MPEISAEPVSTDASDADLLREFVQGDSESAFGRIVAKHSDWIYSSALRMLRDPHRAADVTQAVFVLLARKARTLSPRVQLTGWLFRATRNIALNVRRSESRRRKHERVAATMNSSKTDASSPIDAEALSTLKDQLDDAMSRLNAVDRDALLLRYFSNESFPAIAVTLGTSQAAARKRVARALAKLHDRLVRRGVTLPAAGFGVVLRQMTSSAPPSLPRVIVRTALTTPPAHIAAMASAGSSSIGITSIVAVAALLAIVAPLAVFLAGGFSSGTTRPVIVSQSAELVPRRTLTFTTTRPSAMKVGWLVSYSLAHAPGYGSGYRDHVTAIHKRFLDPQIELYALVEPGSEGDREQQRVIAENFPPSHTLDVTDVPSLRKLNVIVVSRDFRLRNEVADAINSAVQEGTGLLIHVGLNQFDGEGSAQELMGLSNSHYFWTRNPVPCQVVSDHPLLAGLKATLPDGKLTIANLNGTMGKLDRGTPLIEAEDLSLNNIRIPDEVLHPATGSPPKMYPMYLSQLGKGLIVNCQWDSIPAPLVDLTHGRFYIRCCEYLAHRPLD
jgi:RNA polymerase sigma factor (sigma-70 family)